MLIQKNLLTSKKINLFGLKKNFKSTKHSSIQSIFFFDRISKESFFDSKKLFSGWVMFIVKACETSRHLAHLINEEFFTKTRLFLNVF